MKTPVDEHSDLKIDMLWHSQPAYRIEAVLHDRTCSLRSLRFISECVYLCFHFTRSSSFFLAVVDDEVA